MLRIDFDDLSMEEIRLHAYDALAGGRTTEHASIFLICVTQGVNLVTNNSFILSIAFSVLICYCFNIFTLLFM